MLRNNDAFDVRIHEDFSSQRYQVLRLEGSKGGACWYYYYNLIWSEPEWRILFEVRFGNNSISSSSSSRFSKTTMMMTVIQSMTSHNCYYDCIKNEWYISGDSFCCVSSNASDNDSKTSSYLYLEKLGAFVWKQKKSRSDSKSRRFNSSYVHNDIYIYIYIYILYLVR